MFIGHFAVALAAKNVAPKTSLGILFAASQLVDLLWPLFLLLGLENVRIHPGDTAVTPLDFYNYPYTHSLLSSIGWSVLLGGWYYFRRGFSKEAVVVGFLVFSHWLLDFITHKPDLPLFDNNSTKLGLALWNNFWGTVIVEFGIFAVGVFLYYSATKAKDKIGSFSLIALIGILALIHVGNLFGPPPPNERMIAIAGNAMWLFVAWGYWIDKHRRVTQYS